MEGGGGPKAFLSLLLSTVPAPTPDSCSLLTLNEKKKYDPFGRRRRLISGNVYSGDPLDQPKITSLKHVTPRKKVKTLPRR